MVGVPGRSKGCHTCRRRKKSCNLERPVCSRCKRSGLACVGFDLPPTFINTTASKTGLTVTRVHSQLPLRQSFNLAAYEEQYLGVFWDAYLPGRPALGDRLFSQHTTGSWVTVAREISPQDDAVRKALLAVCMILIGQRDEQQWMVHKSLELYTSALDDVRKSLDCPTTWGTDALLVASRALSAYELLRGVDNEARSNDPRPKNWVSHHLGQTAIITRRSPAHFVNGQAHRLFVDGRLQLAIAACLSTKRTFLADPDWLTVPWSEKPKSPKDELVDILVQIPALLEDVEALAHRPESRVNLVNSIRETYAGIDADLAHWKETQYPQDLLPTLEKDGDRPPSSADVLNAHLLTLFWTASLVTYRNIRRANDIAPEIFANATLPEPCSKSSLDSYCQNIADVIGILFHPAAGIFASQFGMFPIACSLVHLTTTQQLRSETADKLLGNFSAHKSRLPLQRFVLGVVKAWPGLRKVAGSSFS